MALSDRHSPGKAQAVLARFIAEGHLLRHLRRMRELYTRRQAVMVQALAEASDGRLPLQPVDHGMHLCADLGAALGADAATVDDAAVSAAAAQRGVLLAPLSRYTLAAARRGWLFGHAAYDEAALRAAAQAVGPLLRQALR